MSAPSKEERLRWEQARTEFPMDPVFPDGKPYTIRVEELCQEGLTWHDAQDVADGELSKLGLF